MDVHYLYLVYALGKAHDEYMIVSQNYTTYKQVLVFHPPSYFFQAFNTAISWMSGDINEYYIDKPFYKSLESIQTFWHWTFPWGFYW